MPTAYNKTVAYFLEQEKKLSSVSGAACKYATLLFVANKWIQKGALFIISNSIIQIDKF